MEIPQLQQLNNGTRRSEKYIKCHYSDFHQYILDTYPKDITWIEKLYWYYHNINSHPLCPVCDKNVGFLDFVHGYSKHCSIQCNNKDENFKNKSHQSCLERYGVENPMQLDSIKEKSKQTCLNKYGVEHPTQSQEVRNKVKQTCLERYGVENPMQFKETQNKHKQTCLDKYGVEYPAQSQEIQNKTEQTCLERYGTKNYTQSQDYRSRHDEIQTKVKQTCLERYGSEYYTQSEEGRTKLSNIIGSEEVRNKIKQTCLERYGVEASSQADSVKEKYKQTCLERYGVEHSFQSDIIKDKTNQTCLKRYGVKHYSQSEEFRNKFKQTCLERYGVKNPFQSKGVQNKSKQTCSVKYGAKSYTQSQEYKSRHDEIQIKVNNTKHRNHTFNSSEIESLFSKYLDSRHIEYKRQYRSEEYPFNCDFYLPKYNLYIEIQASWTHGGHPFNIEIDKDILESWKSKDTDYYNNAIETWTVRDVKKRDLAKQNHLKYLEIFSNNIDEVIKCFEKHI